MKGAFESLHLEMLFVFKVLLDFNRALLLQTNMPTHLKWNTYGINLGLPDLPVGMGDSHCQAPPPPQKGGTLEIKAMYLHDLEAT